MRRGLGVHHADKQHIHHRLMDLGHSQRQAVLLMYLWSALISGCALAVAFIDGRLLVIAIVTVAVLLAVVLPKLVRDRIPHGSDVPAAGVGEHGAVAPVRIPDALPEARGESGSPVGPADEPETAVEPETPRGAAAR
jgi:UDP-GlcNAc:undecaprenyl-phosphate GlcNAc-1-phosphate transferase